MKNTALMELIKRGYPECSSHLIIKSVSRKDVHDFVGCLARELVAPSELAAYVIDGTMLGKDAWRTVEEFIAKPLLEFGVAEGRLIVPRDRPIILLIEGFGFLSAANQRAFSHLVDGEGWGYSLAPGSVLVCALYRGSEGEVEPGSVSRALVLELEAE